MSKRNKRLLIVCVSIVLAAALIAGIVLLAGNKKTPVFVYAVNQLGYQDFYGGDSMEGTVKTDQLQAVYVSGTQEVTESFVHEGQTVTKGTKLMSYDTTLTELSLENKDLEVQKLKLRLTEAEKELKKIRTAVASALKEAWLPEQRVEKVCGVGGTARAVLKIANAWYEKPAGNRSLTPAEVRRLTRLLLERDHQARKLILRSCPDRVHTILPGMMLMNTLTEKLCCGELYISPYGVREGYLCHKLLNAGT